MHTPKWRSKVSELYDSNILTSGKGAHGDDTGQTWDANVKLRYLYYSPKPQAAAR